MADNKISDLPSTATLYADDLLEIEQPSKTAGTRSRKASLAQLRIHVQRKRHVQVMLSDMTTALSTGTGRAIWVAPEAGTLSDVWIAVGAPSTSGVVRIDAKLAGSSIFTTRPAIDAGEMTSLSGTSAVLSGSIAITKGDVFAFDINDAGSGAKALMVTIEYEPAL